VTAGPAELPAAGRRLAPRVTAGVLAGLVLLLTGTLLAEVAVNHQRADDRTGLALLLMLWVIAAVGLVVAWHQPRNPIGWLMLGAPVCLLLILASQGYIHQAYRAGGHALPVLGPAALIFAQQFFVFFVAFPLIILLFPDGRLPSPRWQWALWLYLALSLSAPLALEPAHVAVWLRDGAP